MKPNHRAPGWPKKWTDERYAGILSRYRIGERPDDIAQELGLSRARIYVVIKKAKLLERDRKRRALERLKTGVEDPSVAILWAARACLNEFRGGAKQLADMLVHLT